MFIKINCELVIPQSVDDKNFYPEPGSNILPLSEIFEVNSLAHKDAWRVVLRNGTYLETYDDIPKKLSTVPGLLL